VSGSRDPWRVLNDWQLMRAVSAELPPGPGASDVASWLIYGHTHAHSAQGVYTYRTKTPGADAAIRAIEDRLAAMGHDRSRARREQPYRHVSDPPRRPWRTAPQELVREAALHARAHLARLASRLRQRTGDHNSARASSADAIEDAAEFATTAARRAGVKPVQFTAEAIEAAKQDPLQVTRLIPFIGTYVPKGYKLDAELFVDATGLGAAYEPALTLQMFVAKLDPMKAYAVVQAGQFQVYIGVFDPPNVAD